MNVLWVIPKWTLPAIDGARVATDSLIRNTVQAGATVDVLCLASEEENCDFDDMKKSWGIRDVQIVRRKSGGKGIFKTISYLNSYVQSPGTPLTFSSFTRPHIKNLLKNFLQKRRYDFLLMDGLHLGATFLNEQGKLDCPNVKKVIYRAHNIEADLWKKAQESSSWRARRFLLRHQAKLVEEYEVKIISGSHGVAPISLEDQAVIRKRFPEKAVFYTPLGLKFHQLPTCRESTVTNFLFVGRLDWPPNREGLEWILKEVWPEVIKKNSQVVLKIVGTGDGNWLRKYKTLPGVEILGFVKDLNKAYEESHFTIAPIHFGSGTRIKVIESFAMNRRLISTKLGVQGAELRSEDFIQAETKEDWIKILSEIKWDASHERKLFNSREYVRRQFCERRIGQDFYDWMSTLS